MLVLLFVRGAFSRADASLTSAIVGFMAPSILLGRLTSIAQMPFYATRDMRPPLMSTLVFTVAHIGLAPLLVGVLGVFGLPIALSLATLCGAGYMVSKLQCRFGPIGWNDLYNFALRLCAAGAVAGVGFALGTRWAGEIAASESVSRLLDFFVPTLMASSAFIVGALLFRLIDGRSLLKEGWKHSVAPGRSSRPEEL